MTAARKNGSKINIYILFANILFFCGCLILLSSIWIRRNYGEYILAITDSGFQNFFENKRGMFLTQVCIPAGCAFLLLLVLEKLFSGKLPKKVTVLFGVSFLLVSALLGGIYLKADKYVKNQIRKQGEQWYDDNQVIMHALGMIDGYTYTNSCEALTQNYFEGGYRAFECDFLLTADNELVACHDWEFDAEGNASKIPTRQEFMETKILGKYTPMSIEDIVQFMDEHPDLYLVTDTKSTETEYYTIQFRKIVDAARENDCEDVLDRFIIQIYHPYMYIDINAIYPFDNWIFTLYQEGYRGQTDQMEEYARFCVTSGIDVITMNKEYYSDELLEVCGRYGLRLFVHTVTDEEQKQEFLSKNVGIYVDE